MNMTVVMIRSLCMRMRMPNILLFSVLPCILNIYLADLRTEALKTKTFCAISTQIEFSLYPSIIHASILRRSCLSPIEYNKRYVLVIISIHRRHDVHSDACGIPDTNVQIQDQYSDTLGPG